jgi:hypothetical protein
MKSIRIAAAAIAIIASFSAIGCATAKVDVNPAVAFPLAVSDAAPAFLFPINLSHAGTKGDPLVQGLSVSAGIAAKFGAKVVSGQQLYDLVGNLSFELAEVIQSQAREGSFTMTGPAQRVASDLAMKMKEIMNMLAKLKLVPEGYRFKYIIAVHSHGSPALIPGSVDVNSWGGIYDVDTNQILAYIEQTDTIVNEESAVLGQLPGIYNSIIERLINGK